RCAAAPEIALVDGSVRDVAARTAAHENLRTRLPGAVEHEDPEIGIEPPRENRGGEAGRPGAHNDHIGGAGVVRQVGHVEAEYLLSALRRDRCLGIAAWNKRCGVGRWNRHARAFAARVAAQYDRFGVSRTSDDFRTVTAALRAERWRNLSEHEWGIVVDHNVPYSSNDDPVANFLLWPAPSII